MTSISQQSSNNPHVPDFDVPVAVAHPAPVVTPIHQDEARQKDRDWNIFLAKVRIVLTAIGLFGIMYIAHQTVQMSRYEPVKVNGEESTLWKNVTVIKSNVPQLDRPILNREPSIDDLNKVIAENAEFAQNIHEAARVVFFVFALVFTTYLNHDVLHRDY